ncbi:MAG TPA: rhomboid family intramembrane serine protease [archaeon]|nr:rhomboid family intramembrane serine protease [archaeon]
MALGLFFVLVGVERLMLSDRWPRLNSVRRHWHHWTPKVKAYIRSAPGTFTYLFVLMITTWVLQTSSSRIADQLLLARSTNLRHLLRDPTRVLFASAFWVSSSQELLFAIILFASIAAQVERWLGTSRTIIFFFIGHVGATLLVALWLWESVHFTDLATPVTNAQDVGASYGFLALAAVLAYRISFPKRWLYMVFGCAVVGINLAVQPSFTNWGHLLALGIGFACYFFVPRRLRSSTAKR